MYYEHDIIFEMVIYIAYWAWLFYEIVKNDCGRARRERPGTLGGRSCQSGATRGQRRSSGR